MHKSEEKLFDFAELTELWRDGRFGLVVDYVRHSEQFSDRANLIDFCVYLNKYLGTEELQVLQKLI
jgi:hypothetical protein